MADTQSNSHVKHNAENNEFYMELPDEQRAFVRYHLLEGNRIDFYRTFVPDAARGHGLAAVLVDRALDWAEQQEFEIEASCWYAGKKIAERYKD